MDYAQKIGVLQKRLPKLGKLGGANVRVRILAKVLQAHGFFKDCYR